MHGEPEIHADLCIVGAGPAGISLARELDRSGLRICLIECGGPDIDRRVQRQSRGDSDGYPLHRLHQSRIRAFGGALRHPGVGDEGWAIRPLDPVDFESRPGIRHTGWPFDRDHLDPYYARALTQIGMPVFDDAVGTWSDPQRTPVLPLAGTGVETTLFQHDRPRFHEALGPLRASPDIRLLLFSRVLTLSVDRDTRRVDGVLVRRDDGSRLVVRARAVVLAAGGIENARLLLASDAMRGIGNEHDLVGRFFAERLSTHVGHVVPSRGDLVDTTAFYRRHHVRSTLVCGALRVVDKVQHDRGLLNCVFFVLPRPEVVTTDPVRSLATLRKAAVRRPLVDRASLHRHLRNVLRGLRDVQEIATAYRSGTSALTLRVQGEQAPNPASRVTLGTRRDELGIPRARVTWQVTDDDRASVRASLDVVDAALRSTGLGLVQPTSDPCPLFEGNFHHMGTTRMHRDPRMGVVDPDCRVHTVPNLYVAGSSVFPTYGSSNPTLTIVALALRLADHLRHQLARR